MTYGRFQMEKEREAPLTLHVYRPLKLKALAHSSGIGFAKRRLLHIYR